MCAWRPFKCDVKGCKRRYTSSTLLNRHMKSHEQSRKRPSYTKTYRCPEKDCTKEYVYIQGVQKHIVKKHVKKLAYPCLKCEKSFSKYDRLRAHEFEHTGTPPFRCKFCNVGFTNSYNLRRHHRGHKKFVCDECGKEFVGGSQFRKHYAQEHPPRYTCASCGKEFYNKAILTQHVAAHLETREVFRCPFKSCSRFYFYKKNVDYHVRTFHEERKLKALCPICSTELFNKQKLKQHIETIHRRNADNVIREKTVRRKRKDAGKPRLPLAGQLTGIDLSLTLSENLLNQENVALDFPSSTATSEIDHEKLKRKQPVVVLERIEVPHRNIGTPSNEAAKENLNCKNLLKRLRVSGGEENGDGGELKNTVSPKPKRIKLAGNEKKKSLSQDKENIIVNTRSSRKILLDSGSTETVYRSGLIQRCIVAENLNLSQASNALSNSYTVNVAPLCTDSQNIRNDSCGKGASPVPPFDLDSENGHRDVSDNSQMVVMPTTNSEMKILRQNKIDGVDGSSSVVKSKIIRSSVIPVRRKSGCRKHKRKRCKAPSVLSCINQTEIDMLAVSIQHFSFQKPLESSCNVNSKMLEDGCGTELENVLPTDLKEKHILSHSCSRLSPEACDKKCSVQQKSGSSSLKSSLRCSECNKDYVDSSGISVSSSRIVLRNSTRSRECGNSPTCDGSTFGSNENIGQSADNDDLRLSVSAQKLGLSITENTGYMKKNNIRVRKDLLSHVGSLESSREQGSDSLVNDSNEVCDSSSEAVEFTNEIGQLSNNCESSGKGGNSGNESNLLEEIEAGKECTRNGQISRTDRERDSSGSDVSNDPKRKPSTAGEEGRRLSMSIHTWLSLMKEAMATEIPEVCIED
ncbi:uncharacterized protein [Anabrus simplex]|uniref:uncharacterized protein isoform X2 n=1 Tax=Anabrus simplex TaxID=316456 RepID=UPI0035A36F2A